MLSSAGGHVELLKNGLKFLNTFLNTAGSPQKRIYLQAELEQAGFDIATIKKNIGGDTTNCDILLDEMDAWEKYYVDIEGLTLRMESLEKENGNLRGQVSLLEKKVQVLQDEKGILISLDQCLREKCTVLKEEVHSLKSTKSSVEPIHLPKNREDSTPDDEGISSSERTPTPEEEIQPNNSMFGIYGSHCKPITPPQDLVVQDSEDETTIEDVIQELKDIISNEETEAYNRENTKLNRGIVPAEERQVTGKLHRHMDMDDYTLSSDYEIIPSNLLPQPPRKARKSITSDSSFSVVSLSKYCQPLMGNGMLLTPESKNDTVMRRQNSRISSKRSESFKRVSNTLTKDKCNDKFNFHSNTQIWSESEDKRTLMDSTLDRMKCKSLDRIGDGLETLVDIVVTGKTKTSPYRSKSDSGNASGPSICRSMSTVFVNPKTTIGRKLSTHSEEKQRMFLPSQDQSEVLYYFPRLQEKRSNSNASFLINRGYSNAGLYSGKVVDDHHSYFSKSREMIGSDCRSSGKLTDFPSGLY
ncbi:hypothetical protein JTB14_000219 [Gonioctena quinquepunctata]|nr:hypothetical protein JTB14_000219 [Gonioctena quinquepunctata]